MVQNAFRAATRKSTLARTQTSWVGEALGVELEHVLVETAADQRPDTPVWEFNDRGVFVKEVQAAVLEGRPTSPSTRPRTCRRPPPTVW